MYFKITDNTECENGYQYLNDGLNIIKGKFNDNPNASLCSRGFFHFTDVKNIFGFINGGTYLREVILPKDNKDFKMIKEKERDVWRANMIILGEKRNLWLVDTFKYLIENGADIYVNDYNALTWPALYGYDCIIIYLIKIEDNIHDEHALKWGAEIGHFDIVKFVLKKRNIIHYDNDYALRISAEYGKH